MSKTYCLRRKKFTENTISAYSCNSKKNEFIKHLKATYFRTKGSSK